MDMFNKINSKLIDKNFIKSTIKLARKQDLLQESEENMTVDANSTATNQTSATNSTNATTPVVTTPTDAQVVDANMTDAEVACYSKRYKDLNGIDARLHYITIGKAENRNKHCAKNLTDHEAYSYLRRYPDLQTAFGINFKSSDTQNQAREHFINHGFSQGRSASQAIHESPMFCTDGDTPGY